MITEASRINEYYNALCTRDSLYVGIFFAAIKTTGIFCISICRARKPKPENVVFYKSQSDAVNEGYRPCKICKPMEYQDTPPKQIELILNRLRAFPKERIQDKDLITMGVRPEFLRRWFKQHMGVTFQQYQRNLRLEIAHKELQKGSSVTEVAFTSGYDSLSGFGHSYQHLLQSAPKNAKDMDLLRVTRLTTPLGPMIACGDSKGIKVLEFVDNDQVEGKLTSYRKQLDEQLVYGTNGELEKLRIQMQEYFEGERTQFNLVLNPAGTDFQKSVWKKLSEVPYGQTRTYKQQAIDLGNLKAIRAVARANGQNPIAVIVPCHRIIGSNGKLTGYAGGLARKKWLLQHEIKHKKTELDSVQTLF